MSTAGRLRALQGAALAVLLLLAVQLARMQLLGADGVTAGGLLVRTLPLQPTRGLIVDRNGETLAHSVPQFSLVLIPGDLTHDDRAIEIELGTIALQSGVPVTRLRQLAADGRRSVDPLAPVIVRADIDGDSAIALRAALAGLPGVRVDAAPIRRYAGGELLARVLGFVGPIAPDEVQGYLARGYPLNAQVGRSGVEATYERALRGTPGSTLVATDGAGRPLQTLGEQPATPGADLVLAIDLRLQQAAAAALAEGMRAGLAAEPAGQRAAASAAAAVVMDVRSGELLALVSLPSYDANLFSGAADAPALQRLIDDPQRPMVDRAFVEVNSPGSIFKPIVALAALQEGVATPETRITSTGSLLVQDEYRPSVYYSFGDWAAHGTLDLYGGIAQSSDVYFYYLSGGYSQHGTQLFRGLGADRVARYARAAGLGRATGLDLPGEAAGLVPDPHWKQATVGDPWVLGDTYTLGIGQGYLTVTPLQMAVAAAAIANGGDVLVPRVAHGLRTAAGTAPLPTQLAARMPVDASYFTVVREAMRRAAEPGGTAATGRPDGIAIGGKTGTAEFGLLRADGTYPTHGWFLGFAPFDHPQVAVVVYLQHGVGATHAAPVAKAILSAYFRLHPGTAP